MKISDKLINEYSDYYLNKKVLDKRELTARQTVGHISSMLHEMKYKSIIDVGAGDGAVLQELSKLGIATDLYGVEISDSGYKSIISKNIPSLKEVKKFDGYTIDEADEFYDIALAIHVLEHVEHERAFLREICRVSKFAYIEVPLELTLNVKRSIKVSGKYGHINFYTPSTFENLLSSAGLNIINLEVFPNSAEYEVFLSGRLIGNIKNVIRRSFLRLAPNFAPFLMTYMAGAVCTLRK